MDELHLSYSGIWAKKYLTDTLKCQIMCLDKGDDEGEASRTEDSEPLPAALDPWAQGCLPVVHYTHEFPCMSTQGDDSDSHQNQVRSSWPVSKKLTSRRLLTNEKGLILLEDPSGRRSPIGCTQEVPMDQIQVQTDPSEKKLSNIGLLCLPNKSLPIEKQKTTMKHTGDTQRHQISQSPPQKLDQKKKQGANLSPKADTSKLLPPISHSNERKDVEVKRTSMEQTFLKHKNVSGNYLKESKTPSRLDSSCLPQKWICPKYEIVEVHTKQKPRRESKHTDWMAPSQKPLTSARNKLEKMNKNSMDFSHLSKHERDPHMMSNIERLNMTELAKGVSFIDSQGVEIKPQTCKRPTELTKLKPIQNHPSVPLFSVEQVVIGSPQVTPRFQS